MASVHTPTRTSDSLTLKDSERLRLAKVQHALANNEPLYQKDQNEPNKDAGGLAKDRKKRAEEQLLVLASRSDARHKTLSEKWAERTHDTRVYLDMDLRKHAPVVPVGPTIKTKDGRTIPDPDMVQCSFCDSWLHRNDATHGRGPLHKSVVTEAYEINGETLFREKVVYASSRLVACHDHVLSIKPTVHKDGSITNNIVFPVKD